MCGVDVFCLFDGIVIVSVDILDVRLLINVVRRERGTSILNTARPWSRNIPKYFSL